MTFKVTTKDPSGNPVGGVLAGVCVLGTGRTYQRSSDGGGYSDIALLEEAPVGSDALLSVQKEGFAIYTNYVKVTAADQEVSVTLTPFVG